MAFMAAQVSLAQHSAVHIDHGFSQDVVAFHHCDDEYGHDHDHHDENNVKHDCPECLLAKTLQAAFYYMPATFLFEQRADDTLKTYQSIVAVKDYFNPNAPRAPPIALI